MTRPCALRILCAVRGYLPSGKVVLQESGLGEQRLVQRVIGSQNQEVNKSKYWSVERFKRHIPWYSRGSGAPGRDPRVA